MGRIYESLRESGVVTLDVNLLTGDYLDRSIYRNAVTVNGTPRWTRGPQGWGMSFDASASLQVAHSATIAAPKTVLVLCEKLVADGARIVSKASAGGTDFELYHVAATGIAWTNGSTTRTALAVRPRCVIVTPEALRAVSDVGVVTASASAASGFDAPLYVGNGYAGTSPARRPIYRAMLLNQALSQTAAQALLAELLAERYPTKSYFFQQETITKQIGTPALHWDLKERDASGQFPDLSGNGNASTQAQCNITRSGSKFSDRTGNWVFDSSVNVIPAGNNNHAISIRFNLTNHDGTRRNLVYTAGSFFVHTIGNQIVFSEGGQSLLFNQPMTNRRAYHVVFEKTSETTATCFLNGKYVQPSSGSVASVSNMNNLAIGSYYFSTGIWSCAGKISDVRLYSTNLTGNTPRQLYLEGSRVASCTKIDLLPVSLANMTTANMQLEDTPWRLVSGQWSVVTGKAINCVAAGALHEPAEEIGGTIRATMQWASGGMGIGWTSVKGNATASGQNGYWARINANVMQITKSVAGVETVLATCGHAVAPGDTYDVHFTWEFDGTLTLWHRKRGASAWEPCVTAVDTAVTTNTYCCIYSTAASNQFRGDIARNEIALLPQEWAQ